WPMIPGNDQNPFAACSLDDADKDLPIPGIQQNVPCDFRNSRGDERRVATGETYRLAEFASLLAGRDNVRIPSNNDTSLNPGHYPALRQRHPAFRVLPRDRGPLSFHRD